MNGRDFLVTADSLVKGPAEADWRSAVSRAYYAAFHVARELLEGLGFQVPQADRAHKYLVFRLCNCGDAGIQQTGYDLDRLRRNRNQADYELGAAISQNTAAARVLLAERIIRVIDTIPALLRSQNTNAMKVYERDVLKDVTWHP
jgi:uncharacterized protein (UPF0332 family)